MVVGTTCRGMDAAKENRLDETSRTIANWEWITSGASIPGDWDYMAWVEGDNWEEIWNHIMEIKSGQWKTSALIPIKSWWNQNWKNNWWTEGKSTANLEMRTADNNYP